MASVKLLRYLAQASSDGSPEGNGPIPPLALPDDHFCDVLCRALRPELVPLPGLPVSIPSLVFPPEFCQSFRVYLRNRRSRLIRDAFNRWRRLHPNWPRFVQEDGTGGPIPDVYIDPGTGLPQYWGTDGACVSDLPAGWQENPDILFEPGQPYHKHRFEVEIEDIDYILRRLESCDGVALSAICAGSPWNYDFAGCLGFRNNDGLPVGPGGIGDCLTVDPTRRRTWDNYPQTIPL